MSERTDLIQQIIDLEQRKANLAFMAMEVEAACDHALADQYDEWWNTACIEIGRLQDELWEIDQDEALREAELDREYGAWATGP
jgi:lipoate-protein ligase A